MDDRRSTKFSYASMLSSQSPYPTTLYGRRDRSCPCEELNRSFSPPDPHPMCQCSSRRRPFADNNERAVFEKKEEEEDNDMKQILLYGGVGVLVVLAIDIVARLVLSKRGRGTM
jgi:hypothetical protein